MADAADVGDFAHFPPIRVGTHCAVPELPDRAHVPFQLKGRLSKLPELPAKASSASFGVRLLRTRPNDREQLMTLVHWWHKMKSFFSHFAP